MILQAEVPKRLELRVTVVGDRVLAVAIHSQENPRTSLDWRRYDDRATRHERVELPDDVAERCRAWCRLEGLRYAAFDLVLTPTVATCSSRSTPTGGTSGSGTSPAYPSAPRSPTSQPSHAHPPQPAEEALPSTRP